MAIKNLNKWMETKEHKHLLQKLYTDMLIDRNCKSVHSHSSHLRNMDFLFRNLPDIDFEHLSEDNIKIVLAKIVSSHSNEKTVANYYISFRKWLTTSKQDEFLSLVKVPKVKHDYINKEIITPEELDTLIETAKHPRDKAIIAFLWDTGCRIGEMCACNIKHVEFDSNGARVTLPQSKTTPRTNRVILAAPYLRVWLDNHLYREDPNAPLFYSFRAKGGAMKRLTDEGVRRQLLLIGIDAKLDKRVHPHLFRHSRASYIAEHNIMSEMQMKQQFGWEKASNMAAIYVSLHDDSSEKALLKAAGIEIDDPGKELVQPIRCHRCRELNEKKSDRCFKCGQALSEKAIREEESKQQEILDRLDRLEKRDQIRNGMDILRGEEIDSVDDEGNPIKVTLTDDHHIMKLLRKSLEDLDIR